MRVPGRPAPGLIPLKLHIADPSSEQWREGSAEPVTEQPQPRAEPEVRPTDHGEGSAMVQDTAPTIAPRVPQARCVDVVVFGLFRLRRTGGQFAPPDACFELAPVLRVQLVGKVHRGPDGHEVRNHPRVSLLAQPEPQFSLGVSEFHEMRLIWIRSKNGGRVLKLL